MKQNYVSRMRGCAGPRKGEKMGQESRSDLLFLLPLAVPERYDERPPLWGGSHPSSKTSDILSLCLRRLLPLLPMAATLSPACLREAVTLRPVGCTQNFAPPGDALAVPKPRLSCSPGGRRRLCLSRRSATVIPRHDRRATRLRLCKPEYVFRFRQEGLL